MATDMTEDLFGNVQTVALVSGGSRTLKECLGDSNGKTNDNVGVENWDYGAVTASWTGTDWADHEAYPDQYPHLVKLVNDAASSEYEGGVFAILFWNSLDSQFILSSAIDTSMTYQVRPKTNK